LCWGVGIAFGSPGGSWEVVPATITHILSIIVVHSSFVGRGVIQKLIHEHFLLPFVTNASPLRTRYFAEFN